MKKALSLFTVIVFLPALMFQSCRGKDAGQPETQTQTENAASAVIARTVQPIEWNVLVSSLEDAPGARAEEGTLRFVLANASDGDIIYIDGVSPGISVIELLSPLPEIDKDIAIFGNGITLTPAASWNVSASSQILRIGDGAEVKINRIHFRDGRSSGSGAAIRNSGSLEISACIFSGNRGTGSSAFGGAIYNNGTLEIMASTFFRNFAFRGGAIYNSTGTLSLTGNIFYRDDAANSWPIIFPGTADVVSNSYNVVDLAFGPGSTQSGWSGNEDFYTENMLVSHGSFRLFTTSNAAGRLPLEYITGYPSTDFYGDLIGSNGAAGAVQSFFEVFSPSNAYLEVSVNNPEWGSVSIMTELNPDGCFDWGLGRPALSAHAAPGYQILYWNAYGDGYSIDTSGTTGANTLELQEFNALGDIPSYILVEAVFGPEN